MKKLIFSSLIGLALIAFTGCTKNYDAEAEAKCSASSKCDGDKAKEVATKCSTSSKCGK
jgi:hypothetical protein